METNREEIMTEAQKKAWFELEQAEEEFGCLVGNNEEKGKEEIMTEAQKKAWFELEQAEEEFGCLVGNNEEKGKGVPTRWGYHLNGN
jgi:hypothetical protein